MRTFIPLILVAFLFFDCAPKYYIKRPSSPTVETVINKKPTVVRQSLLFVLRDGYNFVISSVLPDGISGFSTNYFIIKAIGDINPKYIKKCCTLSSVREFRLGLEIYLFDIGPEKCLLKVRAYSDKLFDRGAFETISPVNEVTNCILETLKTQCDNM